MRRVVGVSSLSGARLSMTMKQGTMKLVLHMKSDNQRFRCPNVKECKYLNSKGLHKYLDLRRLLLLEI